LDSFKLEKDEVSSVNGYKYFTSDIRNLIIKLLQQLISMSDSFQSTPQNEFDILMNKFILHIFNLNFEEASRIIKETLNLKDNRKVISN
jgi:hypothetical protein